jgi:hypothetical protein
MNLNYDLNGKLVKNKNFYDEVKSLVNELEIKSETFVHEIFITEFLEMCGKKFDQITIGFYEKVYRVRM